MEWVTEVSREEKPHEVKKKYVMPEALWHNIYFL